MTIDREIERVRNIIDQDLMETLKCMESNYSRSILESIHYSLFTGGKRIRPILAIKTYELISGDSNYEKIMAYASSLEMIHTYSLIHDDLPAMDDDDYRRGKPTNHKKFGEAMAILAGDGLLNLAFESSLDRIKESDSYLQIRALKELAKYSGIKGMIGGQVIDLHLSKDDAKERSIVYMYSTKTAGLIMAALVGGAIIAGSDDKTIEDMRELGLNLGLAYQIKDDFLDIEEDEDIDKITYISVLGKDRARDDLREYSKRAELIAKSYGADKFFMEFIKKLELRSF